MYLVYLEISNTNLSNIKSTTDEDGKEPDPKIKKINVKELSPPLSSSTYTNLDNNFEVIEAAKINEINANSSENLSKRKRKKLLKLQQWELKKKEKRLKEREKYKKKRLEAIANGEPIRNGPSRKALKYNTIDKSTNPYHIAIDLDFDNLMIDKDVCKCAKQLLWVYTINRKSEMPVHLYYTGLKNGSRVQAALNKNDGYQNWDVKISSELYLNLFDNDKIIYLTSDSDNVLTELNDSNIYIIGGLVDHNHHKGLCLKRADEQKIKTARLPISEHVSLKTRTVLTIVHGWCLI